MCRSQISGSTKDHFASENEVCEISQTHKKGCEITSQQKADFAALRSWLSTCSVRLPAAVTPSFQLWIVHRLKHWIADFLRFKTKYSMHKSDFRKAPKVADMMVIKNASWQISLCFPSLHSGFAYGKGLQSFGSSCDYYQKVLFCRPNYNGFKHLWVVIIFI